MRALGWVVCVIAAALVGVGLVQVVTIAELKTQGHCLQSVVEQIGERSSALSDATALRDESLANLTDVLLDPKSSDPEKREAFEAFDAAARNLVTTRSDNPLPNIDERCG